MSLFNIFYITSNKFKYNNFNETQVKYVLTKEPNINDVKEIIISDMCLQSNPCRHNYTLVLKDNTKYYGSSDGLTIVTKYWDLLSQENKYHFYVYKDKKGY